MIPLLLSTAWADVLPVEVEVHQLANGLTVYLAPMDTPGVVAWQTFMDVGSRNESAEASAGFAHLQTRLLSEGSVTLDRRQREEQIRLTGATENSWSWLDKSVYHLEVPSEHLPTVIMMEADRFLNSSWDAEDLERVSGSIEGSWRQKQADPQERLNEALFRTAYGSHPYGHETLGTLEDIRSFTASADAIRAFHDTWYRPERARIVVVGDFDTEATLTQIKLSFGTWEAGGDFPDLVVAQPQEATRRVQAQWTEGPASPRLTMGWKIPGFDPTDPDAAAIEVVQALLFSEVAQLREDLVNERSLVYSITGGSYRFVDQQLFLVELELKHPDDLPVVEAAVNQALAKLASGADSDELSLVRDHTLAEFRLSLDDPATLADSIGRFTYGGLDAEVIDTFYENYSQVSSADVARVVQTWFRPENLTVATLVAEEQ